MERLPTPVSVGLGQLAVFKEKHQFQFQQEPNFPSFFSFGSQFSPVSPVLDSAGAQLPDLVLEPGPKFSAGCENQNQILFCDFLWTWKIGADYKSNISDIYLPCGDLLAYRNCLLT